MGKFSEKLEKNSGKKIVEMKMELRYEEELMSSGEKRREEKRGDGGRERREGRAGGAVGGGRNCGERRGVGL